MSQLSSDNWIICLHRAGLDNTRRALASFLEQDIPVKVMIPDRESTDLTTDQCDELMKGAKKFQKKGK